MKEVVTKNTIEPMTVEIPPIKKSLGQTLGVATGFTVAGIGVLMMISLVLFIPGIFGVLIGLVIAVASTPKTDRKSTRLNSSHVAISYAVFCLKKKRGI